MNTKFKLHKMDRTRTDSARLRTLDFKQLRQAKRERMDSK
jgi:hypothetical protein